MNLDAIRLKLNERNFRLTQEREAVLVAFMASEQMFTPQQLHEYVKESYSRVGLTTVYRLLEVLTKLRLAAPFLIDGEIYYTYCSEGHHHHFVCLQCHRVSDIFDCPMAVEANTEMGSVDYHRVDLYGHCKRCETGGHPC